MDCNHILCTCLYTAHAAHRTAWTLKDVLYVGKLLLKQDNLVKGVVLAEMEFCLSDLASHK